MCVWCEWFIVHISGIWRRTLLRNDLRSSGHTLITHPSTLIYLTLTNTHMFTDTMLFPYFLGDNLISVFLCFCVFCVSVFSVFSVSMYHPPNLLFRSDTREEEEAEGEGGGRMCSRCRALSLCLRAITPMRLCTGRRAWI